MVAYVASKSLFNSTEPLPLRELCNRIVESTRHYNSLDLIPAFQRAVLLFGLSVGEEPAQDDLGSMITYILEMGGVAARRVERGGLDILESKDKNAAAYLLRYARDEYLRKLHLRNVGWPILSWGRNNCKRCARME